MLSKINHITPLQWTLFFSGVIVISLIYSPFVLSLGMIGLLLTALLEQKENGASLKLRSDLAYQWKQFYRKPVFWIPMLFFFLPLLGGLYSEDWTYFLRRLRLKLPFLLLPFTFFLLPKIREREYLALYYLLILVLTITCIGIGINYYIHQDFINDALLKGQSIPVPRNHIRFSLMMAIGIIAGGYLFLKKLLWKYSWERWAILGMTLFLFLFIHVLSVRSGILALYLAIIVLLFYFIYQSGRWRQGILAIFGLCLLPIFAYISIPSFKAKIDYSRWDLKMYMEGKGADYSDSERLLSYQIGAKIIKDNPILGVGTGDLKKEVHRYYALHLPTVEKPKMPHNQLISVWAAHGLLGLFLFLGAFFYPFFYNKNFKEPLFLSFCTIIFFTFMMENTIENSIGLGIFIFFLCWNIKFLEGKKEKAS